MSTGAFIAKILGGSLGEFHQVGERGVKIVRLLREE